MPNVGCTRSSIPRTWPIETLCIAGPVESLPIDNDLKIAWFSMQIDLTRSAPSGAQLCSSRSVVQHELDGGCIERRITFTARSDGDLREVRVEPPASSRSAPT